MSEQIENKPGKIVPISEKSLQIKPFIVMEIMEKALHMERDGADIVHLEVGEPDFDTPEPVKEAAARAMRDGKTHYTHSMGLIELREAIAEHYRASYGVEVSPDRIIAANGTSPAMSLIFSTILSKNDRVTMTDPQYACYSNFVRFADGEPHYIPVGENEGFQFQPDMIDEIAAARPRAVIVNSPSNPTGTAIGADMLERLAGLNAALVSDEIYHGLIYKGRDRSAMEFDDEAFVINGFSKLYAMTGWRVGYAIAPKKHARVMQILHQNFGIAANTFVQWGAIAALTECREHIDKMVAEYDRRRRLLLEKLAEMNLRPLVEPTGAFYTLINFKHVDEDSYRLANEILEQTRVAVTPGIDFGPNGEGFIRFSYANSTENIAEGMRRLRAFLEERGAIGAEKPTPHVDNV